MVVATGWIIAGGILLFILILLGIPVVISFDYSDTLRLKVKYLFLTLYQIPAKPKKKKRKKSGAKKGKKSEEAPPISEELSRPAEPLPATSGKPKNQKKPKKPKKEKNPKNPTLPEIFELVKVAVESLSKPLKKLCKRIKISDFSLEMICGGDDAAKAALNYGRMNLLVANALGWIGSFFTLKPPYIDIGCDFQSEETVMSCSCKIKLSALAALAFVFTFLGRLIARVLRSQKIKAWLGRATAKPKKQKKSKESDKLTV